MQEHQLLFTLLVIAFAGVWMAVGLLCLTDSANDKGGQRRARQSPPAPHHDVAADQSIRSSTERTRATSATS